MGKKTTLPHILRPYLTIVNSDLYYFRFFMPFLQKKQPKPEPIKEKKR